jgi:hypothetical protein
MAKLRTKKTPAAEPALGPVILPGGGAGELVREAGPDGEVVVHAYRRDAAAHDRMLRAGSISRELHRAAETFRADFELGRHMSRFARMDLYRTPGGSGDEISHTVVASRQRLRDALAALGGQRDGSTLSADLAWLVIGEGQTLEQFAHRYRWLGRAMSEARAGGALIGVLERLALHYGILQPANIRHDSHAQGFVAGLGMAAAILIKQAAGGQRRRGKARSEAEVLQAAADAIRHYADRVR